MFIKIWKEVIRIKKKKQTAKQIGNELEKEIKKIARKYKYKVVSNIYIGYKTYERKQKYVEVDIALINKKGIIVIEAKNYSGKITGKEKDTYWNVKYDSGKAFTLYNPILQNQSHTQKVKTFLNVKEEVLKSFIVFSDMSQLEIESTKDMKNYVITDFKNIHLDFERHNKQDDILSEAKIKSYFEKLKKRTKVSSLIKKRHKKIVKNYKK